MTPTRPQAPFSSLLRRLALAPLLVLSLVLPACGGGCGDDAEGAKQWETDEDLGERADFGDVDQGRLDQSVDLDDPDSNTLRAPSIPVSVETRLSAVTVASGQTITVTCELLDQYGERLDDGDLLGEANLRALATPDDVLLVRAGAPSEGALLEGALVGEARVTCSSGPFGLIDETPERVTVTPGAPYRTVATLSRRSAPAGEPVTARCEVYDIHGNLVPDAVATLVSDTTGSGISLSGDQVTITRAADYQLSCQVGGEPERVSAPLEIVAALPAALVLERDPLQQVYGIGQVVTILTYVTDRYDNPIANAPTELFSVPDGERFGPTRVRYVEEGVYVVTVSVTGPTHEGRVLSASTEVIVNGLGPEIECLGPTDGEQVDAAPGSTVMFQGLLNDVNGVQQVWVNGAPTIVEADGSFKAPVTTRYGINFVDVTARDDFNVENSRTCAFQLSDRWTPPGQLEDDALMLKLKQPAIDDIARVGAISSLADLLHVVLNSQGLADTLDTTLIGAGPVENGNTTKLLDDSCATRIIFCIRARVWYVHDSLLIEGPNTTSLTLLQDGLQLAARVEKIKLDVRVRAAGIIDTTGEVEISFLNVDLTSNMLYENGAPRVTLRQINDAQVGQVTTDFNGIDGWIVNLLVGLFQGTVGDLLTSQLESFVNQQFNGILDDLVSSLDVNAIGATLQIQKLDGSGPIPLSFNVNFSGLTATAQRALFGLGASFDGPVNKGLSSLGAAIPSGSVYLDPIVTQPVGAAIHVTIINQVLHALWRAGFFDGTIGAETLGENVPPGAEVTLSTNMPPMLVLKSGTKADLHLGAMSLAVIYPGVFDEPLRVNLGATAKTSVALAGEELSFSNIQIDEFYFSAPGVSLDESTRDLLETFLKTLVQRLVDTSLNDALPALPIPSFTLPASLTSYGLPAGAELGLSNPALDGNGGRHFLLQGELGVR